MNEYNKCNYENNYTNPLNIVNFNNYLKKLVPKRPSLRLVHDVSNINMNKSVTRKSSP